MKKKIFLLTYIFFILFSALIHGEEPDELITEALTNNPQIQAAFSRWQAAREKAPQVSSLPDPMIGVGIFGENVETRVGPQERRYSASQKVPFPVKLSVKAKAALKHAEVMREKYEATRQEIIKKVKFLYYDIYWVDRAIQIIEEEEGLLDNLEKVAKRKYEAGRVHQQDVIKVEVELSKLLDKLYILRQRRLSLVSNLNSILSRPAETEVGRLRELGVEEFTYSLDSLKELAQANRQELLGARFEVERAEYEKSLAKLDYFPDFTLEFDYISVESGHTTHPEDGKDAWMGMVGINLPIWYGRLRAQVREKEELLEASRKQYADIKNKVIFEVEDLFFKINTYYDIVELYRTALIPQTEQSFQAAAKGYETGIVDFLNWLDSERVLLQTRLAYYKAIVDYKKSIAFLERVVGREVNKYE